MHLIVLSSFLERLISVLALSLEKSKGDHWDHCFGLVLAWRNHLFLVRYSIISL
jgi:hypothetical protein